MTSSPIPAGTLFAGTYPTAEKAGLPVPQAGSVYVSAGRPGAGITAHLHDLIRTLAETGPVIYALTENDRPTVTAQLTLNDAQLRPLHHVTVVEIATGAQLAAAVYSTLQHKRRPVAVVVDRLENLTWHGVERFEELQRSSQLLNGLARLDMEHLARLTGLAFSAWTGADVPDLGGHQLAVVAGSTFARSTTTPSLNGLRGTLAMNANTVVGIERDPHELGGASSPMGTFHVLKSRYTAAPQKPIRMRVTRRASTASAPSFGWSDDPMTV